MTGRTAIFALLIALAFVCWFKMRPAPGAPSPLAKTKPREGSVDTAGKFTKAPASKPLLTREAAEAEMRKALQVESLGPDTFALDLVKFDKRQRTVRFPAKVNLRDEIIEYALVATTGKAHEAMFVTEAKPEHLHLAFLLLDMPTAELQGQLDVPASFPPTNAIKITVTWKKNGPDASRDLAELVLVNQTDGKTAAPMSAGPWCYAGSRFNAAGFLAAQEGSFIGLISDSSALIENPRVDRARDDIHFPNKALLPAKGTQVEFVLQLP